VTIKTTTTCMLSDPKKSLQVLIAT